MSNPSESLRPRSFSAAPDDPACPLEAICIETGNDLVVIVGGGERFHIGALALSLSMPGLKNPQKLTNNTYVIPVPGHKEEVLAREGALFLSKSLQKNVSISVGIHQDNITKEGILRFKNAFTRLMEAIRDDCLADDHAGQ